MICSLVIDKVLFLLQSMLSHADASHPVKREGLLCHDFCLPQYPYRDMDGSKVVLHLIHITINTLNAQYHSCRPHATAGPLYSDNSNMSRYSEKEKGEVHALNS